MGKFVIKDAQDVGFDPTVVAVNLLPYDVIAFGVTELVYGGDWTS